MFEKYLEKYKLEMIENLQKLISIRSVSENNSDSDFPFGDSCNKALLFFLKLAKDLGFKTKNVDGYCGYVEFGEGKELLGIIGHLDVVPEGENWTYPPFSGTINDGKIFGRGAIDDKGPVISSLYAIKAVKDYLEDNNLTLNKRIRLIVGLNEEKNWDCINYYKKHEEIPSIGFSPDADFPCIYAEKSVLTQTITMSYHEYLNSLSESPKVKLLQIDDEENAVNVVPKICRAVLQLDNGNTTVLTSTGIQAHAAHPDLGVNAISKLVINLNEVLEKYHTSIPIISFLSKYIGTEFDGKSCGISCEDESGALTLNVGKLQFDGDNITVSLNLRIPVTFDPYQVYEKIQKLALEYPFISVKEPAIIPCLHLSKENPLVKTLCKIYNETMNSKVEPIAIGGATFARAFPNCVSFGANFPGEKDMCHQTDEFISIENLILASIMYAKAIYELGK